MKSKNYLSELRVKDVRVLRTDLENAKKDLFNLRLQNATNQLDDTANLMRTRKNIARINTVISEKEKKS